MAERLAPVVSGRAVSIVAQPRTSLLLGLWAIAFFELALHRFALSPFMPIIASEFNLSYAAVGSLTSAYFLAFAILQLPAGILTDRIGPLRMLLGSLAIIAIAVLLFPWSPSFQVAFVLRVVVGVGAAGIWPAILKLMYVWLDRSRFTFATGFVSAAGPSADVVALWLVPALAVGWGWRWGYFSLAITAPIVLLLCWRFLPTEPRPGVAAPASRRANSTLRDDLRTVFGHRRLWLLSVAQLTYFGGYIAVLSWLPTYYARELGYTKVEAGFVSGFASLALPVALPLCGLIADRLGRRELVFATLAAANVILLTLVPLLGPSLSYNGLIVLTLLLGITFAGIILPYAMLPSLVPAEISGAATGLLQTLSYGANFCYPILLGAVVDATGELIPIFSIVAVGTALSAAIGSYMSFKRMPS